MLLLVRVYTEAGKWGSHFDKEGKLHKAPKSGKTSWGCWLRYFFKDLPPPGMAPPTGVPSKFIGLKFDFNIYLGDFLVYCFSLFVIIDFRHESPNHVVFPVAVSLIKGEFMPLVPCF